MPVGTWPSVSDGDTIKANDLHKRINMVNSFVNLGIDNESAFGSSPEQDEFLESKHVYKPDLFGSPSPRMMGVSSQVHWRNVENDWAKGVLVSSGTIGHRWVPIPGLCTRIKLTERARINFVSSFYAFETGGVSSPKAAWKYLIKNAGKGSSTASTSHRDRHGYEYSISGDVRLAINGKPKSSTQRKITVGAVFPANYLGNIRKTGHVLLTMINRKQQSICYSTILEPGIHDVGIMFRPKEHDTFNLMGDARDYGETPQGQIHKHTYFLARSMFCDVIYEED